MSARAVLAAAAVVVALAGLTGCGSGKHASKSTLIVVNKRIGPFHIGQPRAKVEAIAGKGRVVMMRAPHAHDFVGTELEAYPAARLRVIYLTRHGKASVFSVETTSSDYRTASGVGVGSTVDEVKKLGASCSGTNCELPDRASGSAAVTFFSLDTSRARVVRVGLGVAFG